VQIAQTENELNQIEATSSASSLNDPVSSKLETLRVTGNALIEGVLTVLDTVTMQDLIVNGTSIFFDRVVFKDKVNFDGKILFGKDSAREVIVVKGKDSASIKFDTKYDSIPLINITLSIDDPALESKIMKEGYTYAVVKRTTEGFSIKLNQVAQDDLRFIWIAVEGN
jgi:hypothetical protein